MNAPHAFGVKPYLNNRVEKKVIIRVVVDEQNAELLRRTIISTFGNCIDFVKVQPLAHTHSVKMWFDVTLPVVEDVMSTIMRVLPAAEFGKFRVLTTLNVSELNPN